MGELTAEVLKLNDLSSADELSICTLYQHYYDNCTGSVADDLRDKDFVIVLRDDTGKVQGFSTIQLIEFTYVLAINFYRYCGTVGVRKIIKLPA